jgi:predicted ATPase
MNRKNRSGKAAMNAGAVPQLQLRQIRLERFKAAFCPEPVSLHGFTIIIGRNGSGKSTLIEALQWLDATMRQDARIASDRYHGIHDLITLRSRQSPPAFQIELGWSALPSGALCLRYRVQVQEAADGATAEIVSENLTFLDPAHGDRSLIWTADGKRFVGPDESSARAIFTEPDRLALARGGGIIGDDDQPGARYLAAARQFWERAVFLRLSTHRLAQGSPARRKSFEPLLDEEGEKLPALLNELTAEQTADLVAAVQTIMPDIQGVVVADPTRARDERVYWSLKEKMPYRGRTGRSLVPIPAWMLSEGTRRVTALLALLHHDPLPSLLCVEEIENGLDPWTVIEVLKHLQSAASRGVQIMVTTHSPWLLDHVPASSILLVTRKEGETVYQRFADHEDVKRVIGRLPPGMVYVSEGGAG